MEEARVLIENWRQEYNGIRPHSDLLSLSRENVRVN